MRKICSMEGCSKLCHGRGLCATHHSRLLRHGTTDQTSTIPGTYNRFLEDVVLKFKGDECLLWPFSKFKDGCGQVSIDGKKTRVTRYICLVTHGSPTEDQKVAAHSCGNGHLGCVNPKHLRWATHAENNSDMEIHNTRPRGQNHKNSKLTADQVAAIRIFLSEGKTQRSIAELFGVAQTQIGSIKRKVTWKWLPDDFTGGEPPALMPRRNMPLVYGASLEQGR